VVWGNNDVGYGGDATPTHRADAEIHDACSPATRHAVLGMIAGISPGDFDNVSYSVSFGADSAR